MRGGQLRVGISDLCFEGRELESVVLANLVLRDQLDSSCRSGSTIVAAWLAHFAILHTSGISLLDLLFQCGDLVFVRLDPLKCQLISSHTVVIAKKRGTKLTCSSSAFSLI